MPISSARAKKLAVKYLQKQADGIAKFGERPKLSGKEYQDVLRETIHTIQILSTPIPGTRSSRAATKSKPGASGRITKQRKPGFKVVKPSVAARQMAEA
jgi:phosphoenolpyruvate carboxylase